MTYLYHKLMSKLDYVYVSHNQLIPYQCYITMYMYQDWLIMLYTHICLCHLARKYIDVTYILGHTWCSATSCYIKPPLLPTRMTLSLVNNSDTSIFQ